MKAAYLFVDPEISVMILKGKLKNCNDEHVLNHQIDLYLRYLAYDKIFISIPESCLYLVREQLSQEDHKFVEVFSYSEEQSPFYNLMRLPNEISLLTVMDLSLIIKPESLRAYCQSIDSGERALIERISEEQITEFSSSILMSLHPTFEGYQLSRNFGFEILDHPHTEELLFNIIPILSLSEERIDYYKQLKYRERELFAYQIFDMISTISNCAMIEYDANGSIYFKISNLSDFWKISKDYLTK
jgi:hypothetical protein